MTSEKDAPAGMPGEEDVARALFHAECEPHKAETGYGDIFGWDDAMPAVRNRHRDAARAVLALFAPILAEKEAAEEQAESFKAMYRQAVDWRDEKIAKLTTRAEDAEFAMSRVEKSAASAEARALAAEAALAAERERCAGIAERFKAAHFEACGASGSFSVDKAEMAQALCARDIAAAIRARGE